MGFLRMTYVDFDGDNATTSIRTWNVADAVDYAGWRSGLLALSSVMNSISAGFQKTENHIVEENDFLPQNALSPIAQKKTQMILVTKDSVTGVSYIERIPMPNLAMSPDADTDPAFVVTGVGKNKVTAFNPDHATYISLKAAYDAIGRSPTGNATTLTMAYVEE